MSVWSVRWLGARAFVAAVGAQGFARLGVRLGSVIGPAGRRSAVEAGTRLSCLAHGIRISELL